jgi:6-phosphogluconolactonase (cycloisomerase 2 family)
MRQFAVALLLICVVHSPPARGQDSQENATAAKVAELIKLLDADDFQAREDAEKALIALGESALAAAKAATNSDSAEVKERAQKIVTEIRRTRTGLVYVGNIKTPELLGIVTAEASDDGKFLYAAAWKANAVSVFRRDEASGALSHVQSVVDAEDLGGGVGLRLSPDGALAAAVSFRSKTVALFARDAKEGTLRQLEVVRDDADAGLAMKWPIDAAFSPDSKFVYVLDDQAATVVVFQVIEGKSLKFVAAFAGQEQCFNGARGIAISKDGKSVYVAAHRSGMLSVLDRDAATGRLSVRQLLKDGQDGIKALAGVQTVCASPDGQFVYTCSGRFTGAQAVSAYRVGSDGKLTVLQEFIADAGDLKNFSGGNDVIVSPDGLNLYACGTVSKSVACFDRDPKTGKLDYITTLASAATGGDAELGACALAWSPDARFLYLTVEDEGAISIFQRPGRK